jgi:hypothetical protein
MASFCSRWGVPSLLLLGVLGSGCGFGAANNSPIVTEGPEASLKDVVSGTEVQMHLVVKDEDGDDLVYRWVQAPSEPAGTYSDTEVGEPTWIAPEVSEVKSFLLKVNIRDGEGSSLVSWTTVQVHPRP